LDRLIQVHNYFNVNNLKSDDKLTDEYDFSNRLIKERIHIKDDDEPSEKHQLLANEYLYLKSENQATNLIKKNVTTVLDDTQDVTTYNYDEMGNITRIKNSDNDITYEYDKLSRLTRENNRKLEYSQIFEYDESGNILRSEKYAYTKGELITFISGNTYSYNQGNYQDQLVDFNGEEIKYDGLGRPTTYRNKTLVWSPRSTLLNYDGYQYQYNEQGIRIRKVVGDTTHKYYVLGTKIYTEELVRDGISKLIKYRYFGDKLYGFNYNDIDYYYIRNTQGDITSIITKDGTEVARYTYDAWGNHVVSNLTGDNIGDINPFRYRGYYYDKETQLYYLNARYYDPEVGRFISQHDARKIKEIYPHLMKIMYDKKNQTTND
jgi:RHS repeat-associated protein